MSKWDKLGRWLAHRAAAISERGLTYTDAMFEAMREMSRLDREEPTGDVPSREAHSLCVQCGPDVPVDEDGCCRACGADATGEWADRAVEALRSLHGKEKP